MNDERETNDSININIVHRWFWRWVRFARFYPGRACLFTFTRLSVIILFNIDIIMSTLKVDCRHGPSFNARPLSYHAGLCAGHPMCLNLNHHENCNKSSSLCIKTNWCRFQMQVLLIAINGPFSELIETLQIINGIEAKQFCEHPSSSVAPTTPPWIMDKQYVYSYVYVLYIL